MIRSALRGAIRGEGQAVNWADALLAVALAGVMAAFLLRDLSNFSAGSRVVAMGAVALVAGLLLVRRSVPLAAVVGICAVKVVIVCAGLASLGTALPVAVVLFAVVVHGSRRGGLAQGLVAIGVLSLVEIAGAPARGETPDLVPLLLLLILGVVGGYASRTRREYVAALVDRAARAEASHEEEARRRVAEHRMEIARDLHDALGHHAAVINVQASAAAALMDRDPAAAKECLDHVGASAREVLAELDAVVTGLRELPAPLAPPAQGGDMSGPVLGLARLLDDARRSGASITADLEGAGRLHEDDLDMGSLLAAYRVLQESLTNLRRHAPGQNGRVVVDVDGDHLVIRVDNEAAPTMSVDATRAVRGDVLRAGHGLRGMRERVVQVGGVLEAGPTASGGFGVYARIPLLRRQS